MSQSAAGFGNLFPRATPPVNRKCHSCSSIFPLGESKGECVTKVRMRDDRSGLCTASTVNTKLRRIHLSKLAPQATNASIRPLVHLIYFIICLEMEKSVV